MDHPGISGPSFQCYDVLICYWKKIKKAIITKIQLYLQNSLEKLNMFLQTSEILLTLKTPLPNGKTIQYC